MKNIGFSSPYKPSDAKQNTLFRDFQFLAHNRSLSSSHPHLSPSPLKLKVVLHFIKFRKLLEVQKKSLKQTSCKITLALFIRNTGEKSPIDKAALKIENPKTSTWFSKYIDHWMVKNIFFPMYMVELKEIPMEDLVVICTSWQTIESY